MGRHKILTILLFIATPLFADDRNTEIINGDVLYIGDSHSVNTTMKNNLDNLLANDGDNKVSYFASCGSNASHWLNGGYKSNCGATIPRTIALSELQKQTQAQKVIINLGDNLFSWKGKNPRRAEGITNASLESIKNLAAAVENGKQCFWVGPTWGNRGTSYFKSDEMVIKMYEALYANAGDRCTIVDCRSSVSRDSKGDGLHHHNESAVKAWAQCIQQNTQTASDESDAASTKIEN